jgi:hypothetical protein
MNFYSLCTQSRVAWTQNLFYWRIFAKSLPEKYDFDLYEGFSITKNGPKFARLRKKILPIAKFLLLVPVGSKKYRKILIFSYFHISTCGQIWLNHFQDDSHLGYITKSEKETLHGLVNEIICKPPLALTMNDNHKICYPTFLG